MGRLGVRRLSNYLLIFCATTSALTAFAQTKLQSQAQNQDEVIRVNTELVQTDVMVFDKKGHFVAGLKPEQFVLKIDNKPQPVAFFEQVSSGSLRETKSKQTTGEVPLNGNPSTAARGRTVTPG